MGRKNKSMIKKEKYNVKDDDDEDDIEDDDQDFLKEQEHFFNVLQKVRLDMIEYCNENCLPLCDYLTQDVIEYFVEFLTEN